MRKGRFFNPLLSQAAAFSYRIFGKSAKGIRMPFLDQNLKRSRMHIPADIYKSLALFALFSI